MGQANTIFCITIVMIYIDTSGCRKEFVAITTLYQDRFAEITGTKSDNYSPNYQKKLLKILKTTATSKVITYQNGKPKGKQITLTMKDLQDRIGRYQGNCRNVR